MRNFLTFLFVLIFSSSFAQRYGEIGINAGGMYYLGDLNPGKHFLLTQASFGAFVRHNFNERIAIRGGYTYGSVKGDDAVSKVDPLRNLNFQSTISDISATVEFNFFDYFIGSLRHFVTPYMYAGGTVFLFNPKGVVNGSLTELRPLATEGQGSAQYPDRKQYKKVSYAVPFGIGVKYSLNQFVGMSVDWGMRKTFTDYLDDVSKTYYLDLAGIAPTEAGIAELASDPTLTHIAGNQRGDSRFNDWYGIVSFSISLRLNYLENTRCLNVFY